MQKAADLGKLYLDVLWIDVGVLVDFAGDFLGLVPECLPLLGQGDDDVALVLHITGAGQQSHGFELLQERCQCPGIEEQAAAKLLHGDCILLPQRQKGNILGIGQSQLLQQRAVQLHDAPGASIEGEAELVIELE